MPFVKCQINSLGEAIKLIGPEEHKVGNKLEGRYSWILPAKVYKNPRLAYLNSSGQLCVRIEMSPGVSRTHDFHSPIVNLSFVNGSDNDQYLRVKFEDPAFVVSGHVALSQAVGLFNPYFNQVQGRDYCPQIRIPIDSLIGGTYHVSYRTDYRGTFLMLTSQTQKISFNLWAVGSLSGLSKIVLQKGVMPDEYMASFYLNQYWIGDLESSNIRAIDKG